MRSKAIVGIVVAVLLMGSFVAGAPGSDVGAEVGAAPGTGPLSPDDLEFRTLEIDLTGEAAGLDAAAAGFNVPEPPNAIGPGAALLIQRPDGLVGCTANFIFEDVGTGKTYLGSAGHCFLPRGTTSTHGAGADYNPAGTTVRVCVDRCNWGGVSSWLLSGELVTLGAPTYARQNVNGAGLGNDFGVIEVPNDLLPLVDPGMPMWQGPTTHKPVKPSYGDPACHYGNGVAYGEHYATKGRAGVAHINYGSWWMAATNVGPGDSGSPVVSCALSATGLSGAAPTGVITHAILGMCCTFAATSMDRVFEMAAEAGLDLQVATD